MNRETALREMGVGPIWKLRQGSMVPVPSAVTPPAAQVISAAAEAAPAEATDLGRSEAIARMDWPLLRQTVAGCTSCGLCKGRTNTVFGVGDESAHWMIIGEAPGAEEDQRGEPFVGQAGRLLDAMLAALDMRRDENV